MSAPRWILVNTISGRVVWGPTSVLVLNRAKRMLEQIFRARGLKFDFQVRREA